jgi:hypothetical protein
LQEPEAAAHEISTTTQSPQPQSADDDRGFESTSLASVGTGIIADPNELLDIFRRDLARQVPFISLPAHITAQILSEERPFLYRAIITVASYHDSVHQIALGQELVKYLMEHLLLLGEKNLDLLQGLLVYVSWLVTHSAISI